MDTRDRLFALLGSNTCNGIDFVEVLDSAPDILRVHFINAVPIDAVGAIATIDGGDVVPTVADVVATDWSYDGDARPLLTLHCRNTGDFSNYTLRLKSPSLDRYFSTIVFSFKAFCTSDFDCKPPPVECPPDDAIAPPIDYLAKDFLSFRRALSDFSALRNADWRERSEADFGVMFMEALAALADDLSYQQDRIAAEASLDTATERRSVVQHARLVDYEPRPATCARTWLACKVSAATSLPPGIAVSAAHPQGGSVPFEIGQGLDDTGSYAVDPRWNDPIPAYWFDDTQRCLPRGATEMWLDCDGAELKKSLELNSKLPFPILIETTALNAADPPLRQLVHLTFDNIEPTTDPLFPPGPRPITRIAWSASEALAHERDLTRTSVYGNIVPATQGVRFRESLAIGAPPAATPRMPLAFARLGHNATPGNPRYTLRYSLRNAPLAWLAPDDAAAAPQPEIRLVQRDSPDAWTFKARLLDATEDEHAFCLEPARYARILSPPTGEAHLDYDGDDGDTIRFGDGVFGAAPNDNDVFDLEYRVGAGARGNVAADAITVLDPAWSGLITAVTNPFAATGGADRETNEQIRRRAPQQFRARQFRAVLAEDYAAEARRLAWVQEAGTTFRWTGSWFTVFTAIDPKGGTSLPPDRRAEVVQLLNRRRLCGYESYVPPTRYVSVDLDIEVCAGSDAFQAVVERDVLTALTGRQGSTSQFFFADRFTFGTPLERSRLEDAIQKVSGIAGVLAIRYRRRAVVQDFIDLPDVVELAPDEILRVENDRDHPERGSVSVTVKGGK